MKFVVSSLAMLALCACPVEVVSDGGSTQPALVLDGKPVLGSTAVVNGSYTWTAVRAPRAGTEVYEIAEIPGSTDVWLIGSAIERWNGAEITARFEVPSEVGPAGRQRGALDSVAVISATDAWACGTHLMHFNGTTWTNETAQLNGPTSLAAGCTVAGPSGGKAHVLGNGRLWTIENGVVSAVQATAFVDDTTGSAIMSNTGFAFTTANVERSCLVAMPSGEPAVIGIGVVVQLNAQLRVRQGFGVYPLCRHTRVGDTLYLTGSANDVPFQKAELPANPATFATLAKSDQATAGLRHLAVDGADFIVGSGTGAIFAGHAQDLKGFRVSALVDTTGGTASVLTDRFYGYFFTAAHQNSTRLLVSVQGGGLFQGVKR